MEASDVAMELADLELQFKGQTHVLALPDGVETSVGQLQELVASAVGVAPEAQRLFHGKRRIEATNPAQSLRQVCEGITETPKLLLLAGASKAAIEDMQHTQLVVEREQQIRANRSVVSISRRNNAIQSRDAVSSNYRFHGIEVLEKFSDADKARDILNQLANDRGILAVMEKHKWSVGVLAEMYPDGKVGVDPVCVLGLNQNKGQKILLRLRTDDLLGFRKYLSIKKVLFHELSHNVHSEHDSKFYQLMRQVERECDELDWTHSEGAAIGGSSSSGAFEDSHSATGGAMDRRLGGGSRTTSRLLDAIPQPRQVEPHSPQANMAAEPPLGDANDDVAMSDVPLEQPDTTHVAAATEASQDPVAAVISDVSEADLQPTSLESSAAPTLAAIDPLAEFSDFPMSERERRVHTALRQLQSHHAPDVVASAASVLHKIVSNIMGHPGDAKFRSIRKANRLFESRVGRLPECLEFLLALGFEDQSEKFVLAREDPALLWIGRSTLEVMLPAAA